MQGELLREIRRLAERFELLSFRGDDMVSNNATREFRRLALDPDDQSLTTAIDVLEDAINHQVEALSAALREYASMEETNTVPPAEFQWPNGRVDHAGDGNGR
ncbi:hypothetical protein [Actinoalloteichus spitiensis]|uniref:hypothetical protein n=1 Tax=Actinoalloteichus spitiensis TaxID=252394 RepID=UPI0002FF8A8E|nr:hypothetical protein [Actinoalloteichus spitiensis]